jgi:hyperosmotically inducible periplasmic protein
MKTLTFTLLILAAIALAAQTPSATQSQSAQPAQTQATGQSQTQMGQPSTASPLPTDSTPVIPSVNEIPKGAKGPDRIAREVRHELLMLPYYTVFDDLRFRVNGSTVELLGDVNNPTLKSDAEKAVRGIEGVEQVTNHINVLSPSPTDERLRRELARAVFGTDGLSRYGWEAAPSIHIIVNGGRARLVGVVDSASDKNMAGIAAKGVPGLFAVDNQLVVAGKQ